MWREWLASLDPGIAPFVDVLHAHGIGTTESCQGGKGHAFPEPTVCFDGDLSEGYRAAAIALTHSLPVSSIRRCWPIHSSGELTGPEWQIVFSRTAREGDVNPDSLPDEMEMMARGYLDRRAKRTVEPSYLDHRSVCSVCVHCGRAPDDAAE